LLVWLMAKRKKNPKRQMPPALKRYWAARNKRIKNPRRRKTSRPRRRNPVQTQHVLLAQANGGPVLKFVGGIKFAQTGKGVRFGSKLEAIRQAKALRAAFPVLKRYRMWAT
jgi:hypothetical protein